MVVPEYKYIEAYQNRPDTICKNMWHRSSKYHISPKWYSSKQIYPCTNKCKYKFFFHTLFLRKQSLECFLILSPVFVHFDSECEEYLFPEYLLEDDARRCSDILDFLPSFADDDRLLRVCLRIDIGLDREHWEFSFLVPWYKSLRSQIAHIWDDELVSTVLDTPDLDIARIGDLFTESCEELLTDHFADAEIHRLIGVLIILVEIWSLRQSLSNSIDEFCESCSIHTIDLVVDILPEVSLLEVLLGLDPEYRLGHMRECRIYTLVLSSLYTSGVDETEDDICVTQPRKCLSIDQGMDLVRFLTTELLSGIMMDTRSIEEYDLDSLVCISIDPRDGPLSRLWTIRYSTHAFSDESVDEGGFPGIGTTDDSDISDFWHYGDWVSFLVFDSFVFLLLLLFFSGALTP